MTQPNTGGLFRHSDSGLSPGGCEGLGPRNHGNSEFARAMPSLFHVSTVVDYEPVGNDVITNLLRKVLWEDVMRTQVHEAFVGGEMILTQVHDTSVFFEPSYHDNDVMYLNKNGVADNDDFMPRFVMRYYDRVSRNDGGDTMLIDESEPTDLVDATDTTYLMENGKTICDGNDVMMATVTSGTNGEPCTLVDVTSQVIPERMNVNAFNECTSIWGDLGEPWSADVMGQCWRNNASTAVTIWEDVSASPGNSSFYGEVPRDGIGTESSNTALGFSQSNDAAYFSDVKDEHHGVIDIQSLVLTWHIKADGILSLFGLGPRRTMGRLTLQKTETNGDAICVKELQERYKRVQGSIKSTAVAGNSNFETLSECNETVGHSMTSNVWNPETREVLHRSRLRRATSSDYPHTFWLSFTRTGLFTLDVQNMSHHSLWHLFCAVGLGVPN